MQEQAPAAQPMEVDNGPPNAVAEATGQEGSAVEGPSSNRGVCTTSSHRHLRKARGALLQGVPCLMPGARITAGMHCKGYKSGGRRH